MANTTCCTWMNPSGEAETQLCEIIEQDTWLKKVTPLMGSFFDWFGPWGLWLQSALRTLGIILLTIIIMIPLPYCIVSKSLNACLQPLASRETTSLRLDHHKRSKENG